MTARTYHELMAKSTVSELRLKGEKRRRRAPIHSVQRPLVHIREEVESHESDVIRWSCDDSRKPTDGMVGGTSTCGGSAWLRYPSDLTDAEWALVRHGHIAVAFVRLAMIRIILRRLAAKTSSCI